MWWCVCAKELNVAVTPRKRRVSRNRVSKLSFYCFDVTPRKRRVSRNRSLQSLRRRRHVTPRKRRVSRNASMRAPARMLESHASQEACE